MDGFLFFLVFVLSYPGNGLLFSCIGDLGSVSMPLALDGWDLDFGTWEIK